MPRKGPATKRPVVVDPVYESQLVTQLVNKVLLDGKKSTAESIVYGALEGCREKSGQDPLITRRGKETTSTTIGQLNLKASFRRDSGEPDLVIDHRGPRLLRRTQGRYYNVSGTKQTSRLMTELRQLPPETPIHCAWCAD